MIMFESVDSRMFQTTARPNAGGQIRDDTDISVLLIQRCN